MLLLKILSSPIHWGTFLCYAPFPSSSYHLSIHIFSFKTSLKGEYSGLNYRVDKLRLKPEKVDLEPQLVVRFPDIYL